MKTFRLTVLAVCALVGVMTMSGCKLSNGKTFEDLTKEFNYEDGEITLGNETDAEHYTMGGASFGGQQVKALEIEWLHDSVTIVAYDGNEVVISETADSALNDSTTMYHYLQADGTLNIEFGKPGIRFKGEQLPDKQLVVKVPRALTFQSIELNGIGHNLGMDGVRSGSLEVNSVSNCISLNECVLERVEVNGVSPTLDATFSQLPKKMELNYVSGSTVLKMPEDAGFTLEMGGVKQEFYSELPVVKKGFKYVAGDGSCKIESNGVSGTLDIKVKQ